MALPTNLTTVIVAGTFLDFTGEPCDGSLFFTPSIGALVDQSEDVLLAGVTLQVDLEADGTFEIELLATDDPDLAPSGWTYLVREEFTSPAHHGREYAISVPAAGAPTVSLADLAPALPGSSPLSLVELDALTQALAAHAADTTSVHGIADTSALETQTGAQAKATAAQASSLQKAANLSDLANAATARGSLGLGNSATRAVGTTAGTVAAGDDPRFDEIGGDVTQDDVDDTVAAHAVDTTGVHGIADTSALVLTGDSRLTNARTPTSHASTHAAAGSDPVTVTQAQVTGLTSVLGTKADLVSGKIPTAQIPAIALVDFLGTISTQVAMLALVGQSGDWAIRSDTGTVWVITGVDPTQLSSWTQLPSAGAPVVSVNGHTGAVTLSAADVSAQPVDTDLTAIAALAPPDNDLLQRKAGAWTNRTPAQVKTDLALAKADVGLSNVDNTSDASKPVSTATTTALAGKVDTARTLTAGTGLTGGGDLTADRTLAVAYGTSGTTAAAGNDTRITGAAQKASNLSDLANAGTSRTNLGLGGAATLSVGTTTGTVAAGDDSRITGATPTTRTLTTTAPITGGGDLSANRTLAVAAATTGATGVVQLAGDLAGTATAPVVAAGAITDAKVSAGAAIAQSKVASLTTDLAAKVAKGSLFLNVRDYGAVGDNTTNDTAAIQAAIDAANTATGGTVFFPPGNYRLTTAVVLKSNVELRGAHRNSTRLIATAGVFTCAASVYNVAIIQLSLRGGTGHVILGPATPAGINRMHIDECELIVNATDKSIIDSGGGDWIGNLVENSAMTRTAGATVPGVVITSATGGSNANIWRNVWVFSNNNTTTSFFYLESLAASNWLYDNIFEDIVGESNPGGFLEAYSVHGLVLRRCYSWDASVAYARDIIKVGKGATSTLSSRQVVIEHCARHGGSVAGGVYDINLVPGEVVTSRVSNCGHSSGTPVFNLATDTIRMANFGDGAFTTTSGKVTAGSFQIGTAAQELAGTGSPESVVTAAVGSTYRRTDGSASTTLYVKESGAGTTGWVAVGAAGAGGVPTSRTLTAGTGLTGGGDLTADRTFAVAYGTTSATAAVGNDTRITGAAQKASDLSDLADAATARTNLGLGGAAVLAVGTGAGTVAAGNDSRFVSPYAGDGTTLKLRPEGAADDDGELRLTNGTNGTTLTFTDATGATADVNLYRSAADVLRTDDSLYVSGNATVIGTLTTTGAAAVNSGLTVTRGAALSAFQAFVTGDTVNRLRVDTNGKHEWGPGASTAIDTNLYRSAAGALKTDGLLVAGSVQVGTAALALAGTGTPEGAVTAPVGSVYLRTNGAAGTTLYIKETGAGNTGWRAVPAAGLTTGTVLSPDAVDAKGDLLAGTAADTVARVPVGTDGYSLVADSAQTPGVRWAPSSPDVQVFTASGTWTKPAGALSVHVALVCGGGGGGSGRRGAAATARGGGGGGGGGGWSYATVPASALPGTVTVTVGTGGAGGAAVATNDTNGNVGANGGSTVFGALLRVFRATGGGGGTTTGGTAGVSGTGTSGGSSAAGAGGSTTPAGSNAANSSSPAVQLSSGGGGGGGISAADVAGNGGNGGSSVTSGGNAIAAAGVVDSTAPAAGFAAPASSGLPGDGGAGGAASITTTAQTGAVGGIYGAGGGGGGASLNDVGSSGAGGAGGNGIAIVTTYF